MAQEVPSVLELIAIAKRWLETGDCKPFDEKSLVLALVYVLEARLRRIADGEMKSWDRYYAALLVRGDVSFSALAAVADAALEERRKRFGGPEPVGPKP